MRQDRIIQASIFDLFSEHEIGRELNRNNFLSGLKVRDEGAGTC